MPTSLLSITSLIFPSFLAYLLHTANSNIIAVASQSHARSSGGSLRGSSLTLGHVVVQFDEHVCLVLQERQGAVDLAVRLLRIDGVDLE
eukprot:11680551-Heterocapsa_arctica.AAC.1